MNGSFGPADDLAQVILAGGKSIVAAESGERIHHAKLPDESGADVSSGDARRSEGGATPGLVVRIESGGLGKTGDLPVIVFVGPLDVTVGATERSEVEAQTVNPDSGVLGDIFRLVGSTDGPANIVDGISFACGSAEITEIEDAVTVVAILRR